MGADQLDKDGVGTVTDLGLDREELHGLGNTNKKKKQRKEREENNDCTTYMHTTK